MGGTVSSLETVPSAGSHDHRGERGAAFYVGLKLRGCVESGISAYRYVKLGSQQHM